MVCPFCEGHEDKTPPEIVAYRDFGSRPNGPGWRVRVVPNRFPALKIEGNLNKRGDGIYDVMDGIGAHEVIIESPAHHKSMATLGPDNIREVIWVYRDRLVDLKKDYPAGPRHALQERRRRRRGQPRAHAQPVDRHPDRADLGLGRNDRSARVLQLSRPVHLLRHGPAGARRRKADRARFDPLHGILSVRQPISLRDLDRAQDPLQPLREHPQAGVDDLGQVLHQVLNKLELALDSPAYNYIIHTAPFDHGELPHYHWHIEVIPRLTKVAGFEWGSGFYINPVPPENAAASCARSRSSAPIRAGLSSVAPSRSCRRHRSGCAPTAVAEHRHRGPPSIARVENVAGPLDSRAS